MKSITRVLPVFALIAIAVITASAAEGPQPAPSWCCYTLDAFKIKGGEKRRITVPSFVPNITKVQVYCAWAKVVSGEASLPESVK
jgi:hypothetical protein